MASTWGTSWGTSWATSWDGGGAPPVVTPTVTNNFAGGYKFQSPLWIAHINGKRHVGTYEEIQAIVEGVVEKTEKKPRIVIKPLRTVEQVQAKVPEATIEEAKAVQARIYLDITPMLVKVHERRARDEEDDTEAILLLL